ncbi:MAG: M56 family metallopeptidase [Bacteroidales bacterium]
MNTFDFIFSESMVKALGWTLIHSIWQIGIVAFLLALILFFVRKRSSALKYYLSATTFFILFVASVITFINEMPGTTTIQAEQQGNINNLDTPVQANSEEIRAIETFKLENWIENHLLVLVSIWNICVLMLFIRFISGLFYSQRLCWHRTLAMPAKWLKIKDQLADRMKINKTIGLLESALVQTPVVIGFLKPVILMPVGMVTGLSQQEVEAVIMHELAHIKRNDYLVHIFISLIEMLFFYHPAIWWLSNVVRTERENACDDLAVAKNTDRITLAKALARLELMRNSSEQYALAFTGKNGSILKRIKRMKTAGKTKFTFTEGFISIAILFALAIIMAFSSNSYKLKESKNLTGKKIVEATSPGNNEFRSAYPNKKPVQKDTIITFNYDNSVEYQVDGNNYMMNFDENLHLVGLTVNNKEIPEKDWKKYEKTVNEVVILKKKSSDRDKVNQELVQEMKNEGLIDKDAISYKVYLYDDYMEINEIRQPDAVFKKYMKMYEDKTGGRRDWNVQLNVNPNFYGKSPEEILKIQQESHDKMVKENNYNQQELLLKENELKLQKMELEELYKDRQLNEKQQEFKAQQEKKLQEQEQQLKKQEQEFKDQQMMLQKQEKELQSKQEQVEKQYQELKKQNEQLKKQNEQLKKQNEQLLKEKK